MKITTCCIKGCEGNVRTKGFCDKHYNRWNLYGHPLAGELDDFERVMRPKSKERIAWTSMKKRCLDPNHIQYSYYGGRGIKVCSRWLLSFDNFYEDMGPATRGLSLERKDVNGDYEPKNCKWATVTEQNRNQRTTVLTESKVLEAHRRSNAGEKTADLAREFGVKYITLYQALRGTSWKELVHGG